MRELITSICLGGEECVKELLEAFASLKEIEQKLESQKVTVTVGSSLPAIASLDETTLRAISTALVEALRELGYEVERAALERAARGALELTDSESSFASYIFRRFLYKILRSSAHPLLQAPWEGAICPVCGLVPIAGVRSGRSIVYRCLCGHRWVSEELVCPQCRSTNLSASEKGELRLYRCKDCGHVMVVAGEGEVGSVEDEFFPLAAALLLSSVQGQEGRSAGGGI